MVYLNLNHKNAAEAIVNFVLNSNSRGEDDATVMIAMDHLHERLKNCGHMAVRNDWINYDKYDVALFYRDFEFDKAKKQNPNIKIGLIDPKFSTPKNIQDAKKSDFIIVSSIEQQDAFSEINQNAHIFWMFPRLKSYSKTHKNKNKIIIGYHGNKIHLNTMHLNCLPALDLIAKDHNVELWAIYNKEALGTWNYYKTNYLKIKHINWTPTIYQEIFPQIDIGIVPNLIPVSSFNPINFLYKKLFLLSPYDYITRYKYSSNPGRIHTFAKYNIPVISDFYPSAAQLIEHEHTGLLACSKNGWYHSLSRLIKSPILRQEFSNNLLEKINYYDNDEYITKKIISFIEQNDNSTPVEKLKFPNTQGNLLISNLIQIISKLSKKIGTLNEKI